MNLTLRTFNGLHLAAALVAFAALTHPSRAADFNNAMQYVQSGKGTDRAFGYSVFGLMGRDSSAASGLMVHSLISDPDPSVRRAATLALSKANPEVYSPVMNILYGTYPETRMQGLQDLARLGEGGSPAMPALVTYMRSASGGERQAALAAMFTVAPNDPAAKEWFAYTALRDPDPATRLRALRLLAQTRSPQVYLATFIGAAQNDTDPSVRQEAIDVLGLLAARSDEAVKALERLKDSEDVSVQTAATKALAKLPKKGE